MLATAAQIGLAIDDRYLAAVERDLARAAEIANFLMEFPLDGNIQAAHVFQP